MGSMGRARAGTTVLVVAILVLGVAATALPNQFWLLRGRAAIPSEPPAVDDAPGIERLPGVQAVPLAEYVATLAESRGLSRGEMSDWALEEGAASSVGFTDADGKTILSVTTQQLAEPFPIGALEEIGYVLKYGPGGEEILYRKTFDSIQVVVVSAEGSVVNVSAIQKVPRGGTAAPTELADMTLDQLAELALTILLNSDAWDVPS